MVGPVPYPGDQRGLRRPVPEGIRQYWKGNFVKELTDEAIAAHVRARTEGADGELDDAPVSRSTALATASRPDATAFGHRDANFSMVVVSASERPADDEANIEWVRDYSDAVAPLLRSGRLHQLHGRRRQQRVPANYGANYDRLVEIKRKYDPDNLFRVNQNTILSTEVTTDLS